jgi:two-component system, NarL family, nitrate/nitrite response regulator NarL
MQSEYEIVIVERNALVREGLARLLDKSPFRTAALAARLDDLAANLFPRQTPVLVLIGASEDMKADIRTIRYINQQQPTARIVVFTERPDVDQALRAFRAGAHAYLAEVTGCSALIKSLELVMLGEAIVPFSMLAKILDARRTSYQTGTSQVVKNSYNDVPALSAREKCILDCLADGSPNKTIARQIDVAEATVKVHVKAILRKIRVQNRTQAAIWALHYKNTHPASETGISTRNELGHPDGIG